MNSYKKFIVVIIAFLFTATCGPAPEKISDRTSEKSTIKAIPPGKYNLKVRISSKNESAQATFNSDELTWPDVNNVFGPPAPGWIAKNGIYNWRPADSGRITKIPLKQPHPTKNIPINELDEIHFEYQDLFPDNPVQPLVSLTVSGENASISAHKNKPLNRKLFFFKGTKPEPFKKRVRIDKKEVSLPAQEQSSQLDKKEVSLPAQEQSSQSATFLACLRCNPIFMPKDPLNVASALWKKKDIWYLIKRKFGLPFDNTWNYSQDGHKNTVFQRRFHMNLTSIETIDLVLQDDVTEDELDKIRCNFRITYADPAGTLHVVPHRALAYEYNFKTQKSSVIKADGKKIIRFMVGDLVRKSYKDRKIVYLAEMLISFPGSPEEVVRKKPVESIQFQEQKYQKSLLSIDSLDVSSSTWEKMNTLYLIKRELGFPQDTIWRYKQDRDVAVFKRILHKNLHLIEAMDIILKEAVVDDTHLHCRIRIGFRERPWPSEVVNCRDLPWQILKTEGKHILRIHLNDLVRKRYNLGKENVFLEELTVYLPGQVDQYIKNKLLQTTKFYLLPEYHEIELARTQKKKLDKTRKRLIKFRKKSKSKPQDRESIMLGVELKNLEEELKRLEGEELNRLEDWKMARLQEEELDALKDENVTRVQDEKLIRLRGELTLIKKLTQLKVEAHDQKSKSINQLKELTRLKEITKSLEKEISTVQGLKIAKLRNTSITTLHKVMQTQTLSKDSKRITINLREILDTVGRKTNLENLDLLFKPTNPKLNSGFHLKRARTITRKNRSIQSVLTSGTMTTRQLGGPFINSIEKEGKLERVKISAYFPFENIDENVPYRSNKETRLGASVQTSKGAIFRLLESNEGLVCDFWFLSKDAVVTLKLPGVGPFTEDRDITLNWKTEGPLKFDVVNSAFTWINNSTSIEFLLSEETIPTFSIRVAEDAFADPGRGIRGRLILKNVQQHSSTGVRLNTGNVDWNSLGINQPKRFLKEIELTESLKTAILANNHPVNKIILHTKKNRKFFDHSIESDQDAFYKFSKSESGKAQKTEFIRSKSITIQAQKPFDQWRTEVDGLTLKGDGKWIEVDWTLEAHLEKGTRFYMGISEGVESIVSMQIIPFSGEHQLASISTLPNQPVQLNLPGKTIDRMKVRLKLDEDYLFKLVLKKLVLFEPIAVTEAQALSTPLSSWNRTPLTPEQVLSRLSREISINKGHLKAVVIPERGSSETVNWYSKIYQKSKWVHWVDIEYQVSPTVHTFNPCWLQIIWVGPNQQVPQTICTQNSEGRILTPVSESFTDEFLESIRWTAHLVSPSHLLPLPASLDLKMNWNGMRQTTPYNNIIKHAILETPEKKIYPVSFGDLTGEEIISGENLLGLGIHSIDKNKQELTLLDHPYLNIDSLSLDKVDSHDTSDNIFHWINPQVESMEAELPWMSLVRKFLLVPLVAFFVIRWLCTARKWSIAWRWIKATAPLIKEDGIKLLGYLSSMLSFIQIRAVFLNRLFGSILAGLAVGIMISNKFHTENIIFMSTILLLLGVMWHEFRRKIFNNSLSPSQNMALTICFGKDRKIPVLVYTLTCGIALWLIWILANMYSGQYTPRLLAPLLVLVYFYIPWLARLSGFGADYQENPVRFWLTVAGSIYLIGSLFLLGGLHLSSFLKILSTGHLAFIPFWFHLMKNIRPKVEIHWPDLAGIIFAEKENQYVAGFFVFLLPVAILRVLGLKIITEQFAIIGFYLLITGIALKVNKLYKCRNTPQSTSGVPKDEKHPAT